MSAQLGRGGGVVVGHDVGDEAAVTGGVLARQHDGVPDGVVADECSFDLARLDAKASDLDLVVDSSEELDAPVL
jgi:hypothetical protein